MTITEKITTAHPRFSTKSKDECVEYINENKGSLLYTKVDAFAEEEIQKLQEIFTTKSAEEIYEYIGDFLSTIKSEFNDIHYREDCFEYLTGIGISPEIAILITEEVRKGIWNLRDSEYKKSVPADFFEWAEGVKYLVSREVIFEDFLNTDKL